MKSWPVVRVSLPMSVLVMERYQRKVALTWQLLRDVAIRGATRSGAHSRGAASRVSASRRIPILRYPARTGPIARTRLTSVPTVTVFCPVPRLLRPVRVREIVGTPCVSIVPGRIRTADGRGPGIYAALRVWLPRTRRIPCSARDSPTASEGMTAGLGTPILAPWNRCSHRRGSQSSST